MEGFSFSTDVRVRFAETDAQGIAHHAAFVVWFEVARVAYLERHAGGYQSIRDRGLEALTTEVRVRYHRAAYFDERLTVWARCVGRARCAVPVRVPRRAGRGARRRRPHESRDRRARDVPADTRPRVARGRRRRGRVGAVGGRGDERPRPPSLPCLPGRWRDEQDDGATAGGRSRRRRRRSARERDHRGAGARRGGARVRARARRLLRPPARRPRGGIRRDRGGARRGASDRLAALCERLGTELDVLLGRGRELTLDDAVALAERAASAS